MFCSWAGAITVTGRQQMTITTAEQGAMLDSKGDVNFCFSVNCIHSNYGCVCPLEMSGMAAESDSLERGQKATGPRGADCRSFTCHLSHLGQYCQTDNTFHINFGVSVFKLQRTEPQVFHMESMGSKGLVSGS